VFHLPVFENPTLRVDERNPVAAELEPTRESAGIEHATSQGSEPVHVIESRLAESGIVAGRVHHASTAQATARQIEIRPFSTFTTR